MLNQNCFQVFKLPLTVSGCYNTTYLNKKLFSHKLKVLNYDGLWENKKLSDKKSTLRLDNIDSFISIGQYQLVLPDNLTLTIILKNENTVGGPG